MYVVLFGLGCLLVGWCLGTWASHGLIHSRLERFLRQFEKESIRIAMPQSTFEVFAQTLIKMEAAMFGDIKPEDFNFKVE
jgi:hypothetical protein